MISAENLEKIKQALVLTPSSFGLQPWKFVILKNKQVQNSLVEHSYGQAQVWQASHVIVLCRKNTLDESLVEEYIDDMMKQTWAPAESLEGYKNMMLGFLSRLSDAEKITWANKQIYIALWNIMTVLSMMKIDSCPMEGFIAPKYDEILDLQSKWLSSVLVLPIWYRAEDDTHASRPKIRYSQDDMILEL